LPRILRLGCQTHKINQPNSETPYFGERVLAWVFTS
jgi:hypothetical protein